FDYFRCVAYQTRGGGIALAERLTPDRVANSAGLSGTKSQGELYAKNKLVDHILKISAYSDSVDTKWIQDHFDDWGGMENRDATTKVLFLQRLTDSPSVQNARLILKVLMSIKRDGTLPDDKGFILGLMGGKDKAISALRRGL